MAWSNAFFYNIGLPLNWVMT